VGTKEEVEEMKVQKHRETRDHDFSSCISSEE
jgi:hypothetical protein